MLLQRSSSRVCRKKHKNITYDANGALLTDGLRHYAYDSEGRLAAASLGWASTATTDDSITKYAHNSQAQRVFKTAPLFAVTNPEPTATPELLALFTAFFESLWAPSTNPDGSTVQKAGMSYVYDEDGTLIAQTLTGGATTTWGQSARYIYLPTASGPMPVAAIYGTKHYAIQSDHLNTPRRLIQSDGQVAWQWAYSAFGEEKPTIAKNRFANTELNQSFGSTTVPAVTFNLRYPGQYFDQESNLHYNYHRSYSAMTGRYTQSDPIGLDGGWNRFNYVDGNPLGFTDPSGLVKLHGNWCGPNWTGGFERSYDKLSDPERKVVLPPATKLDSCCQTHDMTYAVCRKAFPCDAAARQSCFEKADRDLSMCASNSGTSLGTNIFTFGNPISRIADYMRDSKPAPEPNAEDCSCKK